MLLVVPGRAKADPAWNNGNAIGPGSNCDLTGNPCGGVNGWTIFDNFEVSNGLYPDDTLTGFTYDSDFAAGSAADYQSTNWSLWSVDPLGYFTLVDNLGPMVSGNTVAALTTSDLNATTYTFTVTGLSINLTAGATYWLGYENVLAPDGAITEDVMTDGTALAGYEQESDDQNYQFTYYSGNTAFTVETTPEPGSLWLVSLAAAALFVKSRMRPRVRRSPAPVEV
jgi:hypothetical protein